MQITEVKPSQRKRGRFLVKLEDEEILRVTEEELLRFGLRPGMELEEEQLAALRACAKTSAAKATAANMIGSRALSRQELEQRLIKKGNSPENARTAVEWLEDIGAVDDAAYAAALVRHYSGKGYGTQRIREEFYRRGVPRQLWEDALAEMPESGEILDALIRKRVRGDLTDVRELKRISDGLLRRGFSWSEVKAALGRYAEMTEDTP